MVASVIPAGLRGIPNVGPATARDLVRLGIRRLPDLRGKDPVRLYERLGKMDRRRHDPCVLDTLCALADQAAGKPARPWWHYSRQRLRAQKARQGSKRRPG